MQDFNSVQNTLQSSTSKVMEIVTTYSMGVLGAIAILIAGWLAAKWLSKLTLKALRKAKTDETLSRFFSSMVSYGVLGFTVIAVMGQFGIQTTSLVALMGAMGLAIGLALQGTLSHVASGVMLLIFRPFKIGDYIEGGSQAGTVEEIGLFTTTMNTPDNVHIIIPNGQLWDSAIKNYSSNKTRRVTLTIGIGYADDINQAIKVILGVINKDKRTLKKPSEPMVAVANLGESSVDLTVRAWCNASDFWPMNFELTKEIKEALDKANISIPYPQRDLHIVSDINKK